MTITSMSFAIFTVFFLSLYYLLPRKMQNNLLLVASYLFLASWDVTFAIVFALLTAVNFLLARKISQKDQRGRYALRAGILINLLVLVYFKYADFFIPNALEMLSSLGFQTQTGGIEILLPIGLSFYVVQAISYLRDVDKKIIEPTTSAISFAVYMAYFPRLISGPIERAGTFIPKLATKRIVDNAQLGQGAELILHGLFRKVVIADLLFRMIPSDLFETPKAYSSPELVIWLLAYGFALYNDFAGYTRIIRGVSHLFGIELSKNFNVPYFSRNFTEFWQRWHITLSDWLRDYIFMPFTRTLLRRKYKRDHVLSIVAPPMITMFVSALWHNVSWNMLVWGGLHGLYQVVERTYTLRYPPKRAETTPRWRQVAATTLVFVLVMVAWVPFRTELPVTIEYWSGLLSPVSLAVIRSAIRTQATLSTFVLIGSSFSLDLIQHRYGELAFQQRSPLIKAIILNAVLFTLFIAFTTQSNTAPPFVYQGF